MMELKDKVRSNYKRLQSCDRAFQHLGQIILIQLCQQHNLPYEGSLIPLSEDLTMSMTTHKVEDDL